MEEVLIFIFSSFWTYTGTLFLIFCTGYSAAIPFYWYYKLKQNKLNKSIWNHQ
jgi:hypothetical protein